MTHTLAFQSFAHVPISLAKAFGICVHLFFASCLCARLSPISCSLFLLNGRLIPLPLIRSFLVVFTKGPCFVAAYTNSDALVRRFFIFAF